MLEMIAHYQILNSVWQAIIVALLLRHALGERGAGWRALQHVFILDHFIMYPN